MAQPYLIRGAGGATHPRLEIRDLHKNHPEQFTLFILGWAKIRDRNHSPLAAQFVQQAGIHGLPYERWPGDPAQESELAETKVKRWHGYCNHESVLFPTWHRPSLMLLEQSICETTSDIAKSLTQNYPDEATKWQEAAKAVRFPYWDWTDPSTGVEGFPRIFTRSNLHLTVPGPNNPTMTHPNILAFYSFNLPLPPGFDDRKPEVPDPTTAYFSQWDRTYRWPAPVREDPRENLERINQLLTGTNPDHDTKKWGWRDLTSKIALLFGFRGDIEEKLYANTWDEFSNTTFQSAKRGPDKKPLPPYQGSLESPHNLVHLLLGGSGNMGDNDYASFDPIFFLHHANIDRILAFWEHVYPNYYIGENGYLDPITGDKRIDFTQPGGSASQPEDYPVVKGSTALAPFRKEVKEYWTSATVRSLDNKYYTYPPILDPTGDNNVVLGETVTPEKRELQRAVLQKHFQHDPVQIPARYESKVDPFEGIGKTKPAPGYEKVHNYRQFIITVQLPPYAHGGSYSLDVFYGKEHIGSAVVLGRSEDTKCQACQGRRAAGNLSYSVIVVPHTIVLDAIEQDSKADRAVPDKVKSALRAEIVLAGGQKVGYTSETAPARNAELPEEKQPKLWLHSVALQARQDPSRSHDPNVPGKVSPITPYEPYDWTEHGSLAGHWASSAL